MKNLVSKAVMKVVVAVAVVSTLGSAFANAALGDVMTQMNKDIKAITAHIDDPTQNQASAALADDFAKVVVTGKNFAPDTVTNAQTQNDFNSMLDQCAALGTQLAAALRAGNTAGAKDLLNQLAALKGQGHSKFQD